MTIHFYLRFYTRPGESLYVTGNTDELGNNNIEHAFPLTWLNNDLWTGTITINDPQTDAIKYNYIYKGLDGSMVQEWDDNKSITITKSPMQETRVLDTWNHPGEFENAFYTDPFQQILLKSNETRTKPKAVKHATHYFKAKAPLLQKNEVICVLGGTREMADWDETSPVLLHREDNWWAVKLDLPKESFPIQYKYGIYNIKTKTFVRFEEGENRWLHGDALMNTLTVLHDGFVHLPNTTWKGAGVVIPVFSLRSKNSFGVGEFTDLKLFVDWAAKTGMKMIQILPVNDTTATHTWVDSYPYAAISAFALHPMYLNITKVAGKEFASLIKPLKKKQAQLNELPDVDYEAVMHTKLAAIKELYMVQKDEWANDEDYQQFFENNKHWLVPYAVFCSLRDRYGTADFNQWKSNNMYNKEAIQKLASPKGKQYDQVAIHYFTQYHLHLQLQEAAEYAHKNGIILKGDLPIGVYRYGSDAWVEPELYHLEMQAGAPPDDFAVRGQNWGFPTYNWERMAADGYEWWHRRFIQMSNYFDAFRIDHILGFFRIWSIPIHAVEGIMGRFVHAVPVHVVEFEQRGIWFNPVRYCQPFINDAVLWDMFGPNTEKFKPYLDAAGNQYTLKPEFATQRQVEAHFDALDRSEENQHLRQGLYDLISNVIFFEQPGSNGTEYHFRIGIESTTSFRHLDGYLQDKLKDLYVNYFYHRQEHFWMQEGLRKLPALKRSTNMLICGEDLGMVPHCVPEVMKQLGIASLEIQRMPKDIHAEFFHPAHAPYLSVVTPATHDMSTIRGWWEEDRTKTQRFYNYILGQWGDAPPTCEAWINKAIVIQHLQSPALWATFQLQDLLGMNETLRRENPNEERINIPAMPKHYWRYRMHITLEQLLKEKEFNSELEEFIKDAGR
ncbi:4-alpha-glucanotransferase [Niastella populi]|uniref:4-alpha-glucanotransferase n=1 Tax=Niastella populi TaxID=550983 RepID=A0A1V9FE49_9BACT|nr:4-alpha-glucanotransferase [Niastella populi]OQP56476.1 4-alpha-glucanotransferase [Niastella populi]